MSIPQASTTINEKAKFLEPAFSPFYKKNYDKVYDSANAADACGFPANCLMIYTLKEAAPTNSNQTPIVVSSPTIFKIHRLINYEMNQPLDIVIEQDDDGFIARSIDMPLYGSGDDCIEALTTLKQEIESLYEDLITDDKFSKEWLKYKSFLMARISPC